MEVKSTAVKDLYYIKEMNAGHDGIDLEKVCPNLVQKGERDLDLLFYTMQTTLGLATMRRDKSCKYTMTEADEEVLLAALESPKNVKELYMAVATELIRGNGIDGEEIIPQYAKLVKEDDSVLAGSLAVMGAVRLWKLKPTLDLEPLMKLIDIQDMFAQADSFDKQISFDSDPVTTSHFIKACIAVADYTGTFPLLPAQTVGFANFAALGVATVTTSDIYYKMQMIKDLGANKYANPAHVQMISRKPFHHVNMPIVVGVFTLDGNPTEKAKVTVRSVTSVDDNQVILANQPMKLHNPKRDELKEKQFSNEEMFDSVYELKWMDKSPRAGYYDVELEVKGEKFVFTDDALRFRIKVAGLAAVQNVRVGLGSKDKSVDTIWHDEKMPDDSQAVGRNGRVKIEFSVNEKLADEKFGDPMTVHQAFIRCLSYINYEAVTFIAEAKDGKYSAQFDISDHFEHGGLHHMQIIVGDALIFPGKLEHHVGFLTVNGIPEPEKGVFQTKYLKRYNEPKPIKHTFKEPEPRPPMMISVIFTGACAIPLFGLLVAWSRLGVNVNKMESSFMLFHGAIASVFGLYFMYWLKLNMFDTLKYLAVLGSATFILGNRVLSKLATKEK